MIAQLAIVLNLSVQCLDVSCQQRLVGKLFATLFTLALEAHVLGLKVDPQLTSSTRNKRALAAGTELLGESVNFGPVPLYFFPADRRKLT